MINANQDVLDARHEQEQLEALHRLDEECIQLQRIGNYLKAFDCMERALVLRRHFFGVDSPEVSHACKALCEMCNLLSMSFLQQDNYAVTIELLKKAEVLSKHHPEQKATTLNNMACYYRRLGKLHTALTCLSKALSIEKKTLRDNRTAADTHLNICAVLSQLGKHSEALEHAQSALITLQEEYFRKTRESNSTETRDTDVATKLDRVSVMCIAYHNMGVEQEFLKDYEGSAVSYKKGVGLAEQYLGVDHAITVTVRNSYLAAKRTISVKASTSRSAKTLARDSSSVRSPLSRLAHNPRVHTPPSPLRLPTPVSKDKQIFNQGQRLSPRSIIADSLARGNTLPPLESPPRSASKHLSPEDPFFSPRFRFDTGHTKQKIETIETVPVDDGAVNDIPEDLKSGEDGDEGDSIEAMEHQSLALVLQPVADEALNTEGDTTMLMHSNEEVQSDEAIVDAFEPTMQLGQASDAETPMCEGLTHSDVPIEDKDSSEEVALAEGVEETLAIDAIEELEQTHTIGAEPLEQTVHYENDTLEDAKYRLAAWDDSSWSEPVDTPSLNEQDPIESTESTPEPEDAACVSDVEHGQNSVDVCFADVDRNESSVDIPDETSSHQAVIDVEPDWSPPHPSEETSEPHVGNDGWTDHAVEAAGTAEGDQATNYGVGEGELTDHGFATHESERLHEDEHNDSGFGEVDRAFQSAVATQHSDGTSTLEEGDTEHHVSILAEEDLGAEFIAGTVEGFDHWDMESPPAEYYQHEADGDPSNYAGEVGSIDNAYHGRSEDFESDSWQESVLPQSDLATHDTNTTEGIDVEEQTPSGLSVDLSSLGLPHEDGWHSGAQTDNTGENNDERQDYYYSSEKSSENLSLADEQHTSMPQLPR